MRPWHERFPEIYADERHFWLGRGFAEADKRRDDVAFTGLVTARAGRDGRVERREFKLRVGYPPGYPYVPPRVTFIDPPITRARHQGVDGAPCLFPPQAWTSTFPGSEIHVAIERWLGYHLTGHFPRELAVYELPAYFASTPFSVLATPTCTERMAGRRCGRMSVEELVGYELGVLWSVDEQVVGKDLVAALAPGRSVKRTRHAASWYRLDREPPAVRNTAELQRVLATAGHGAKFGRRPREKEFVGLLFPDAVSGQERLLVLDIGVASRRAQAKVATGWSVRCPELYIVSVEELFRRLEGIRDLEAMDGVTAGCFGLGAIGSPFAEALAREGVGGFVLCDPDRLRPGNIARHALDLRSIGQPKADALEEQLARINPWVTTRIETQNLSNPAVLAGLVDQTNLVLAAIGDDLQEELLGEVVFTSGAKPPMLLARTLHGGDVFRVALLRPGIDACIGCLASYREKGDARWIDVPSSELPDVYDTGCAASVRPGAGLTSRHAALFAAARAIEILEGRAGDTNHWIWVERPVPDADPRLSHPTSLHTATFLPRPDCELCSV